MDRFLLSGIYIRCIEYLYKIQILFSWEPEVPSNHIYMCFFNEDFASAMNLG